MLEIRAYNSTSGAYTAYQVQGVASDTKGDGAGTAWWANFGSNQLSRLSTSNSQVSVWEIPGATSLYSTAIDSSGDVWVSDYFDSFIYQLDPVTNQLCSYTLPDSGISEYLYNNGQQLWFGDSANGRIVRLQNGTYTWWTLPATSDPRDLELDVSGKLWWTDAYLGYLGRLDPTAGEIATFTPPASGTPVMLKLSNGKVWYSQQSPSGVVMLDPAIATSVTTSVTTGSQAAAPTCSELLPLAPTTVTANSGQASWTGQTYATALDTAGWKVYAMPPNGIPWGINATNQIWLVDQGRQMLAKLTPSYPSYLPLVQK